MARMDDQTASFLEYRRLLFSIAYNMLGHIDAAEDIVQDTFVKWQETEPDTIRHPKAFLVKVVTNKCINYLNSARVKREQYIGIWLPEPLQDDWSNNPLSKMESYHALSIGLLVLLERLTPRERAVFLLKEIFAYDHYELADIFDITADNCRQILKRAKEHLGKDTRRFEVDMKVHEKILQNFVRAISEGNMEALIDLLKEDIQLLADGGGSSFDVNGQRLSATRKPIEGRENVSRLLGSIMPKFFQYVPDIGWEVVLVNGLPSIISFSGTSPFSLVSLETDGERIRNIYVQTNPEKLSHFKKV